VRTIIDWLALVDWLTYRPSIIIIRFNETFGIAFAKGSGPTAPKKVYYYNSGQFGTAHDIRPKPRAFVLSSSLSWLKYNRPITEFQSKWERLQHRRCGIEWDPCLVWPQCDNGSDLFSRLANIDFTNACRFNFTTREYWSTKWKISYCQVDLNGSYNLHRRSRLFWHFHLVRHSATLQYGLIPLNSRLGSLMARWKGLNILV